MQNAECRIQNTNDYCCKCLFIAFLYFEYVMCLLLDNIYELVEDHSPPIRI